VSFAGIIVESGAEEKRKERSPPNRGRSLLAPHQFSCNFGVLRKCFRYKAWLSGLSLLVLLALATAEDKKPKPAPDLSAEERKLFDDGKELYQITCLSCHQLNGMGQESLAPPLVGSHWVTNSTERLVRITLHGLRGPIKVNGRVYEFPIEMPPLAVLSDEQIAGVLTYVRREWGHTASTIAPAAVKKIREATSNREQSWTEPELNKIP